MFKWFHEIWNPHCPGCRAEKEESKICQSCETLLAQLAIVNAEKKQLLESILEANKPAEAPVRPQVDYDKLKGRAITWNIRRQMMEAEDRKAAALMKDSSRIQQQVNDLEKELGVENAGTIGQRHKEDIQSEQHEESG